MAAPDTTQQHAVDWLRRAIVAGELRPGHRVPQEDVAARIGVSVVPLREALRVLEGEGQVTYRPRRGYFVTELRLADLQEIYALRELLEARAARHALARLDEDGAERIVRAAADCADVAASGDVARTLAANRRFHFALLDAPGQPHLLKLLRTLWDATEAYRALYYNAPQERAAAIDAHDRIVAAVQARDADRLVAELDEHRRQALVALGEILPPVAGDEEPQASFSAPRSGRRARSPA
jgi:DNA-binding GntR family transcriptional regulator